MTTGQPLYDADGNPVAIVPVESVPLERQGMSGCTKGIMGCGCVTMLVFLCLCGTGVYFAGRAMVTDATQIQQISDSITDIQVPPDFSHKQGMNLKDVPLADKFSPVKEAVYFWPPSDKAFIGFGKLRDDSVTNEEIADQVNNVTKNPGDAKAFAQSSKEEVKRTIRGKEATFTIIEGKFDDDKKGYRVYGKFQGKDGPAAIIMTGQEPELTKEKVLAVIDSIK